MSLVAGGNLVIGERSMVMIEAQRDKRPGKASKSRPLVARVERGTIRGEVKPGDALPHGLRASYGLVSDALCEALRALGVAADRVPGTRTRAAEGAFDCFATPAADEICVGARKLVGSAQRRAGGAVLQHGSLRVRPDSARARRAAGLDADGATSLCELGVRTRIPELRDACVEALCRALGGDFEVGTLTERERSWAAAGARRRRQEAAGLECSPPTGISRVPSATRVSRGVKNVNLNVIGNGRF